MTRTVAMKAVLGLLCAYHVCIGLASMASAELTADFAHWFYGTDITVDARFVYTLKALGMYALFTGALCGVALTDPARYRPIVWAVIMLQSLRAGTRLVFFDTLHEGLGVSWEHNLVNASLLVAEAAILLWGLGPWRRT